MKAAHRHREAECAGKTGFKTYWEADAVAKRYRAVAAYRCHFCKQWHVGGTRGFVSPKRPPVPPYSLSPTD